MSRMRGITFLLKYICKGNDSVTMQIVEETGRYYAVQQFQDVRYMSASEAACRIVDNDAPVHCLEVHTEEHQERQELPATLREPLTKLTEWFKGYIKNPPIRSVSAVLYLESH